MNIDKIVSWSSLFDKDVLDSEVEMQNPFSGSVFYGHGNKTAYILMAPWHSGSYVFSSIKRKIRKIGGAYVQYNLIPDILSPDVEATRSYFEIVNQNVRKDLLKLHRENGVDNFIMVGMSLGCVFAMMVSDQNPLIKKLILVVPGNSLAESLWGGIRTIKIKRMMKKRGLTLTKLKKYWNDLSPENYISHVKDKNFTF